MKVGKSVKYKNQKMKIIGFLNLENELTENYKPQYKIVVQDNNGIKWIRKK